MFILENITRGPMNIQVSLSHDISFSELSSEMITNHHELQYVPPGFNRVQPGYRFS